MGELGISERKGGSPVFAQVLPSEVSFAVLELWMRLP
jgi:hypothetical protein